MNDSKYSLSYAPKVPLGWILRLYRTDALGVHDNDLAEQVGWRIYARCHDVLMVTNSHVICPRCQVEFAVCWIGVSEDRISTCPGCGWQITAAAYHAGFRHQDLLGHAGTEFTAFVARFPTAQTYAERLVLIDRVVHAVHVTGGVAARNLLEGRSRQVLAQLDALAGAATTQHRDDSQPDPRRTVE